jgi:signal transduction histidine kinase
MGMASRPAPIGRLRASTWLALAAAALGLVVAACAIAGVIGVRRTADTRSDLVDRHFPAEAQNLRLIAALVNEETGVRGYALTGRGDFLSPYLEGRQAEQRALAALARLARGAAAGERLPGDLARIRSAADAWRTRYAEPLIADVRGHPGEPLPVARADAGKTRFDAVRSALRTQEADIVAARDAARDRLRTSVHRLNLLFIVLGAALVLAAALLVVLLRRVVSRPLSRLGEEVRQVAGGDLRHHLSVAGPADVMQLASDVESMRGRIVDELGAVQEARSRLERQTGDLERSNAELEQFAYVASHDLQEPLRKVASFCQLLQRRYQGQLDERADQYIEYAVDGAKRMQSLISDLLAFSRVGRTEFAPERVDLGDVLRDALDNLARRLDDTDAMVESSVLPDVMGERSLLVAVFQNLIGNALKFSGDGPPVVRVDVQRDGNQWVVSCSDEGIGIEPQYAERIFAIFQRLHAKETYEGTGIGLALTRKIVEHHGGRIWLDTGVPRGTTFRFTLPVAEEFAR